MWLKSLLIVFVIFLASSRACDVNQSCDINMDDENVQIMQFAMETFMISFMNIMYSDTTLEGNVTFSPPNIYVALFLLMVASKDNAKNELIAALQLVNEDINVLPDALVHIVTGLEVLNTANIRSQEITIENLSLGEALYVQKGLNIVEPFTKLLRSLDANSYPMDFAKTADLATKKINQWINNQTGKRTPITITSALDPATKLFLATAVFMSAKWPENFFDPAHNTLGTFKSVTGQTNVIMMNAYRKLFFYDNQKTFAAIQIPFQNKNFVLHIVLPYGNMNPTDFLKSFDMDTWLDILDYSEEKDIAVQIPKFSIAWTNQIDEQIKALKIKQIFQGAKFPGLIENSEEQLHITSITHSAGLTINEIGLSMPDITPPSANQDQLGAANIPPAFIVDRPCLFLVRQIRSNLIVFSSFIREL